VPAACEASTAALAPVYMLTTAWAYPIPIAVQGARGTRCNVHIHVHQHQPARSSTTSSARIDGVCDGSTKRTPTPHVGRKGTTNLAASGRDRATATLQDIWSARFQIWVAKIMFAFQEPWEWY
jgi:hypothetical protein